MNLFMKQCYLDVWSLENIHKLKTQKLQIQKTKKILSSKCAVCDIKNMRLVKEQDADALLIIISKIPLIGPLYYNRR